MNVGLLRYVEKIHHIERKENRIIGSNFYTLGAIVP